MDILERIVASKRKRLEALQQQVSLSELYRALERTDDNSLEAAKADTPKTAQSKQEWPIAVDSFNVIAEVKRASPSLGAIPWTMELPDLVHSYQRGGAAAISVLTEEDYFGGSVADLKQVKALCSLPVLRKDFLFTEYQIVESKLIGADAVLLIVSLLSQQELCILLRLTKELGMAALVECREASELYRALEAGAETVGINNRDLRTFEVNLERTAELAQLIPKGVSLVSESGIKSAEDAYTVARAGASAVLVGESCLRQCDPATYIEGLVKGGRQGKEEAVYGTG